MREQLDRADDPATRRYVLGHPNGLLTEYQYDEAGRLLSVRFGTGTPDVENSRVDFSMVLSQITYSYDKAGNRVTRLAPNQEETYKYDGLDRLLTVVGHSSYGYDEVGNRRGRTRSGLPDPGSGVPSVAGAVQATYNDRNELLNYSAGGTLRVEGWIDEPGTVSVVTGSVETPARMVDTGPPGTYEFELEVPVSSGTSLFAVKALDASGNLRTSQYRVDVPQESATFRYDLAGNLAEADWTPVDTWSYEWNGEGQLTRVAGNGTEVARFAYDPLDRRVEKVADGVTTSWAYDGDDIVQETVVGGSDPGTFRYAHGPGIDEPLARENVSTGTLEHYHADALGSIVATTNQAGQIVATRRYDAWGNLELGYDQPGYAFTGREWDPETGLYYYRARYYDPLVGRFISEDPIGFKGGVNFYGYVGAQPTGRRDPDGNDWIDSVAGFGDTLTYGGTAAVRQWLETDDLIDQSNWGYTLGEAAGVGLSLYGGGAAGTGAAGAKAAGLEFSHWIPDRILKKFGDRWLRKGFGRSCFNGNYVPTAKHALSDPHRYRFMPRPWKASNPLPSPVVQQWNRIPLVFKGAGAGGSSGAGGAAANESLAEIVQ